MEVLCRFGEACCSAVYDEDEALEGGGLGQGGESVVSQFAVARGVDELESGLIARSIVVFGAVLVFAGADLGRECDEGCGGGL